MRLPASAHTAIPWRIHDLTRDFRVEDVWSLPTPGGPDDFPRLVDLVSGLDPERSSSTAVRALFAVRWRLGGLLGLDNPNDGVGARVPSLRDRLPDDLATSPGPDFGALSLVPLFSTDDEMAAEIANRTMHGVMHLGWVADDTVEGGYRGQLAVLVKPNGLLGKAYMAAISPFRYLLVYPRWIRSIGRDWQRRSAAEHGVG